MPTEYDIAWTVYLVLVVAVVTTLAVVVVRLMLAGTRALNAYTEDRKLRTALLLDEFDQADETRVR